MHKNVTFLILFGCLFLPEQTLAASYDDMMKECKVVARRMMEEPATFRFISAMPANRDKNKGVSIKFTGSKENLKAKLSCFYINNELSKLHLEAEGTDGEEINEYLADFLVNQVKEDLRSNP